MKKFPLKQTRTAMGLAIVAVLTACASVPAANPRLTEARAAYDKAAADALVVRSAPVELQQAQQALQRADAAMLKGDDVEAVDHYAYLARQRTEVAVQAGRIAQADQAVAESRAQRDRILIDARTRDAEAQRAAADKARISAELSRSLAEQSRSQAEQSRSQADAARSQADAARKLAEERLAAAESARQQATVAKTRANTLEAQMAELKARQTDRGMVLTLGDVLFDSGRSTLKAGAMRTVDQLARFMDTNPARKVLIEGHTDSVGSDSFNRELSLHRAEAVQQALKDRRIEGGRVEVSGLGEGYPVANNDNASGRQQNRRVEVIISDEAGSIKARAN